MMNVLFADTSPFVAQKRLAQVKPKNRVTERFSEVQLREFKATFDKFDKDRSGYLDIYEIQTVLKEQGRELSEEEVVDLVRLLELN